MRKIGIKEIEDIALGAALLGAGGGGDPYVGKLVAMGAVKECGEVTLLDPDEIPDDALVVPIAMMGAPTVLAEKGIGEVSIKLFTIWFHSSSVKRYTHFCQLKQAGLIQCSQLLPAQGWVCRWSMPTEWAEHFRSFRWLRLQSEE